MSTEYAKMLMSQDFNIIDEEQRIVEGIVTDDKIDIDGHIIDKAGFQAALTDFMPWGNIRDQHGLPAAKLVATPDWNRFQVKVVDDGTWNRIRGGLYKGFSIGIRVLGVEVEDVNKFMDSAFEGLPRIVVDAIKEGGMIFRITKMVLGEVSIVDRPANPRALITTIKSMQTNRDVPYMPVMKGILKAQNNDTGNESFPITNGKAVAQGEIEMNEITQQVDSTEPDTIEKEVATTEDNVTAVESRIASLEKSVADLTGAVSEIGAVRQEIQNLTKAIETLAPKTEDVIVPVVVVEETVAEVKTEDEKAVTVDVEKTVTDLVSKAISDFSASVEKKFDEALAKLEPKSIDRVGGVNGGSDDEDVQKEIKTTLRKATYKDVALNVASKIGIKE